VNTARNTASTTTTAAPAAASTRLPSALRIGIARGAIETKAFFRQRESLVFIFLFPLMMLVIFSSIFTGNVDHTDVPFKQVFAAGIIASAVMGTSFQSLAIQVSVERDYGALKRLYGTPMPRTAYFIGKMIQVLVVGVVQTAIMLTVASGIAGLKLPSSASAWLTFGWVFVLGIFSCALLGLATSTIARSGDSAAAVVTPPFILLQFISGVFFPFSGLPSWMQHVAAVFPLKWLTQGMRSVFLPAGYQQQEMAHSWEHGRTALILGAWAIGGLFLCLRVFRWQKGKV
jgi:ABC-2 type transport system permease protein